MEIKNLREEQLRWYIGKHVETGEVISGLSLDMIKRVYGLDTNLVIECILGERETAGPYKWIVLTDDFNNPNWNEGLEDLVNDLVKKCYGELAYAIYNSYIDDKSDKLTKEEFDLVKEWLEE